MRSGCDARSSSLTASLAVVAFLLATPALADCPELVGSLPGDGSTTDLAVSGDYAYLSDSSTAHGGLRVIDVSEPSAPVPVWGSSAPVDVSAGSLPSDTAIAVSEGYVYLGSFWSSPWGGTGAMGVIDVSTPSAPVEMGYVISSSWPPLDVAIISGRFAYVAMGAGGGGPGLEVIDVTWPWMPFEICFFPTTAAPSGVAVEDGFAYVAGSDGLTVIDVTIPPSPLWAAFLDTPDEARGVAVEDGFAYVAGSDGLRVIDVNEPWGPFEVGFLATPMPASDVAVSRGYAYVTVGDYFNPGRLCVIDVSTPSAPVEVGSYEIGGKFYYYYGGIAVSDGYVFVGNVGVPLIVFRECPLYADGFESGDTSAWSGTVP